MKNAAEPLPWVMVMTTQNVTPSNIYRKVKKYSGTKFLSCVSANQLFRNRALIHIPYARVNCLKTIPLTTAHTYIARTWQ